VRERKGKEGKGGRRKGRHGSLTGGAWRSAARARVTPDGELAGPRLGRKQMVGWLVGCGPRKEVKVSYLIYSYFLSNSNLNSKFEFEFT
jgi:hypothetical protein